MTEDLSRYRITPDTEFSPIDLDEEEFVLPDGRRLTDELAEQIAADVVARRHPNLVPGGKSLSGDGKHSPRVNVRLREDVYGRLLAFAEARHTSVSTIAREAVERYIATDGPTHP